MICVLCNKTLQPGDKKRLVFKDKPHYLHKDCLRKTTQKTLIEKSLIDPGDLGWWTKL